MWRVFLRPESLLRLFVTALACAALILVLGWKIVNRWLDQPLVMDSPVLVQLPAGGNLTQFLASMRDRGLLAHPNWLRVQARVSGVADRVRAGEYLVEPGMTPRLLLNRLVSGDVVVYTVTLVEGMTVAQVLARLHDQPKLQGTLRGIHPGSLLDDLEIEGAWPSAEGAFFPDTYQYSLGMSDADVLRSAYRAMTKVLEQEWAARAAGLPYREPYEALIMASLVEKETGVAEERPDIAGVFVRRLGLGMLLQTDPSVIFGLGDQFQGNLTRAHLRSPGPYNTYMNRGLPPTPIAIPGRAAINAALNPAGGTSLYFVAKGDGSHEFSATLEAHNRAVRRYQLRQRASSYRSSPQG